MTRGIITRITAKEDDYQQDNNVRRICFVHAVVTLLSTFSVPVSWATHSVGCSTGLSGIPSSSLLSGSSNVERVNSGSGRSSGHPVTWVRQSEGSHQSDVSVRTYPEMQQLCYYLHAFLESPLEFRAFSRLDDLELTGVVPCTLWFGEDAKHPGVTSCDAVLDQGMPWGESVTPNFKDIRSWRGILFDDAGRDRLTCRLCQTCLIYVSSSVKRHRHYLIHCSCEFHSIVFGKEFCELNQSYASIEKHCSVRTSIPFLLVSPKDAPFALHPP